MELVTSVNKIMKHPRKSHYTRSTKSKSFNNRKHNVLIKSSRFHRSNSIKNSLKQSKSKSQEEVNNIINNIGTENKPFSRSYEPNSLRNSLKLKCTTHESNDSTNLNGNNSESLEQRVFGEFTR